MGSCMVKYAGLLQFKGTNYAGFQKTEEWNSNSKCVGINVESN